MFSCEKSNYLVCLPAREVPELKNLVKDSGILSKNYTGAHRKGRPIFMSIRRDLK